MKVLSYSQGVSVRRFAMEEVAPVGGAPYPTVTAAIQRRYAFEKMGASVDAQQRGALTPAYETGEFEFDGKRHNILGLEFMPDGLRAIANTTEVADRLVDDLLAFASKEFGYRIKNINKPALYASTLIVECQDALYKGFGIRPNAAELLEQQLEKAGKKRGVRPYGVRFLAVGDEEGLADALMVFEKRANPESNEHSYFSQAPLSTSRHEDFLRQLLST